MLIYKLQLWDNLKIFGCQCLIEQAKGFVYYNFVKIHKTLRVPPAMEAGLIKRLMTIEDVVKLAD